MKKFDLHIHTLQTISDHPFTFSFERLKQYVEWAKLDVIAITNHNVFDTDQFRFIQENLSSTVTVLPGIEVNVGQNAGHLIIITDNTLVEEFAIKCSIISKEFKSNTDFVTLEKLREVFIDFDRYFLIPHYEKSPQVDRQILDDLKQYICCGEVSSVKKFVYCKKNNNSLTPVYFSDWRPEEESEFPVRSTWIDVEDINVQSLKRAVLDKTKVQLSEEEGHQVFQALPNVKLSTGLTVIMGGRSSGKSYTLNQLEKNYDNIKYIRQFSLLETNPEKSEEDFNKRIAAKQSAAMRDYFSAFSKVVDDIVNISIHEDENAVECYINSLLKNAAEIERADLFSKCTLYTESSYTIADLESLKDLIKAVEKLLEAHQYQEIIERNIDRNSLKKLHKELIEKYISENQNNLKKIWVNDVISNIKIGLQSRTAATRVEDVDFYQIQLNRIKVKKFEKIVEKIKRPVVIDTQNIEGFSIQVTKRPFEGAGELKLQSGRVVAFSGIFDNYQNKPYEYLCGLKQIEIIPVADYYKFFAKIEYKILNQYGYEVSGGERAEFNLLQEINDAYQYDMLLIDEPESSFDNIFLKERVNHIIKDISSKLPVVIVTHNNTVGASINPDYIVYTNRKIINHKAVFEVYYGKPSSKVLCSRNGDQIKSIDITLDCLEAGENAYEERKHNYEMLRD